MQITPDQFDAAYSKLPYQIREFIATDSVGTITLTVGKTYNLHVDTIGALERETTNMLLGLINPEQFVAELKSAGIPQESIPNIVAELNTKIFVPLREKMRNPSPEDAESGESEENAAPSVATVPVAPVAAPVSLQPVPPITSQPITPLAPATPSPSPVAQPSARPAPVITPVVPIAPITPPSSVSQFSPLAMPIQSTPLPKPKIQPQQTQNRDDLHAVLKEYGIDPYREPPE
jgi:hypothetical protein